MTEFILGILIAAIGTGISAAVSSSDQDKARAEAKSLAMLKRQDELAALEEQKKLSYFGLGQQKRLTLATLAEQRREAELGRAERKEESAYQRKQQVYGNALALVNSDIAMQNRMASFWGGR